MKFKDRTGSVLSHLGISLQEITPLAGDASARSFSRVNTPRQKDKLTAVLIVFPEGAGADEVDRYLQMGEGLTRAGIPVPEVYQANPREGYIIVEDCGDELLQDLINRRDPTSLYCRAIDLIIEMQDRVCSVTANLNPPFNEEKFLWEMDYFLTHTLRGYYGADPCSAERTAFRNFFHTICRESLIQAMAFCHRDYHSRNLMVSSGRLMVIDFQDGRLGPYPYDLASLIEDPYADLSMDFRDEMKQYYFSQRPSNLKDIFLADFMRDYDMISIQRLIKAAGTYGYMFKEKGNPGYLAYLPKVFRRVNAILEKYPELLGLKGLLEKHLRFELDSPVLREEKIP